MNAVNQVLLRGRVTIPEKIHTRLTAHGKIMYFELETCELRARGTIKHLEYHNIVLRDCGRYRKASLFGSRVIPGCELKITGRLRTRLVRDLRQGDRLVTEIDASRVEPAGSANTREAGY